MLSKWICRLRVKYYLLNATAGATELCGPELLIVYCHSVSVSGVSPSNMLVLQMKNDFQQRAVASSRALFKRQIVFFCCLGPGSLGWVMLHNEGVISIRPHSPL